MTRSRFTPIDPESCTPEQKRLWDRANAGPRTRLGIPLSVMLHSPGVADPLEQLSEYVRFRSPIPKRIKELMILIIARHWTAQYPWSRHYESALAAGINQSAGEQIARGERPTGLAADEEVIYEFCTGLLRRGEVADATYTALKSLYGESGLIDLVGMMSYYCTISMALAVDNRTIPDGNFPRLERI